MFVMEEIESCYFFIVYRMGRLCGGAHEISGIKAQFFSVGGWWVVGWMVGWGWWWWGDGWWGGGGGVGWGVLGGVIRLSFQSNSNSQKLSLWCKKKIITHPDGFV